MNAGLIVRQMRAHAPFTAVGTLSGVAIMVVLLAAEAPTAFSSRLFWVCHPLHVLLSALVTTAMYRLQGGAGVWRTLWIGYVGSVGIATLSDSIIPFVGEWLLGLPNRGVHLGFVEKWWLVNPLALLGIAAAAWYPRTKLPHAAHVMLSTWASLFHMTMAMGSAVPGVGGLLLVTVFLFLAVWVPCCTSDIGFPLLFVGKAPVQGNDDARAGQRRSPIRLEVVPFLLGAWLLLLVAGGLAWLIGAPATAAMGTAAAVGLVATASLLFFFRDPERTTPKEDTAIVAGADGRVMSIRTMRDDRFLKTRVVRISTFLSLFDVHVNRAPTAGRIALLQYSPGHRFLAFQEKASDLNQHSSILIEGPHTRCLVKQIVGRIARRVVHWLSLGQQVQKGERIGMMKFGSRLDMFLPDSEVDVLVKPGDRVRAGETVVARVKNRDAGTPAGQDARAGQKANAVGDGGANG